MLLGQAASEAIKNCCFFVRQTLVTRDLGGIYSRWHREHKLQFQFLGNYQHTPYAVKLYRGDGRQPSTAL